MLLELKHIYKNYLQDKIVIPVLKDVNISIDEGEYVAIMGPSGSGKTTLMNIIGCLDRPTKGEFLLEGESIVNYNENRLSDLRLNTLGFVFQSFNLLPKQTALDNVALPLSYAGVPVKKRKEIAFQALKRVGLAERVHFRPSQLSGGQQQRTAIGRAIVKNPDILLCDEPTGALDYNTSKDILRLIETVNQKYGNTIVMVTHNDAIKDMADRVVKLRDGMIRTESSGDGTGVVGGARYEKSFKKKASSGTTAGNGKVSCCIYSDGSNDWVCFRLFSSRWKYADCL